MKYIINIYVFHQSIKRINSLINYITYVYIYVVDPPKWPIDFDISTDKPLERNVIQGGFAKMLCPAQGFPKPKIIWYKDGRELTGNELSVNINDDGSLDIPVAQVI